MSDPKIEEVIETPEDEEKFRRDHMLREWLTFGPALLILLVLGGLGMASPIFRTGPMLLCMFFLPFGWMAVFIHLNLRRLNKLIEERKAKNEN